MDEYQYAMLIEKVL